jgi:hypothetical protein
MICLLLRIKLGKEEVEIYEKIYRDILEKARKTIDETPADSQRMVKRMTKFEQETLLFMYDFDVPFTNNLAERDIRMPNRRFQAGLGQQKGRMLLQGREDSYPL